MSMGANTNGAGPEEPSASWLSPHDEPARMLVIEQLRAENERLSHLADIALDLVERACRKSTLARRPTVSLVQRQLSLGFGAASAALQELHRRGRLHDLPKSPQRPAPECNDTHDDGANARFAMSSVAGVRAFGMTQASENAAAQENGEPGVCSVGIGARACSVLAAASAASAMPATERLGGLLMFCGLDSDEEANSMAVLARHVAKEGIVGLVVVMSPAEPAAAWQARLAACLEKLRDIGVTLLAPQCKPGAPAELLHQATGSALRLHRFVTRCARSEGMVCLDLDDLRPQTGAAWRAALSVTTTVEGLLTDGLVMELLHRPLIGALPVERTQAVVAAFRGPSRSMRLTRIRESLQVLQRGLPHAASISYSVTVDDTLAHGVEVEIMRLAMLEHALVNAGMVTAVDTEKES